MFCCLTASIARALLCMADEVFGIQMIVEAVVACPEPEHSHLFASGYQVAGVSLVVPWVLVPPLASLLGLEDGLRLRVAGGPIHLLLGCAFLCQRVSSLVEVGGSFVQSLLCCLACKVVARDVTIVPPISCY